MNSYMDAYLTIYNAFIKHGVWSFQKNIQRFKIALIFRQPSEPKQEGIVNGESVAISPLPRLCCHTAHILRFF